MRQRHASDLGRHLVGDQTIEPALGAGTCYLVLREGGEIDDADALTHQTCFVADVLEVIGPAEAPPIARLDAAWGEPVGTLPAVALPPDRAPSPELLLPPAGPRRGGVGALLVRKMPGVPVRVGPLVLLHQVALASVRTEAARIDRQHVDAGFPFDDPLGELPAGTARCGDAEAVSLVEPHIA